MEKWTVYKILECNFQSSELEQLKQTIYTSLIEGYGKKPNEIVRDNITDLILTIMEKMNVEVDDLSCSRMSTILLEVVGEFKMGCSAFFDKIMGTKGVEVQNASSEECDDGEEDCIADEK